MDSSTGRGIVRILVEGNMEVPAVRPTVLRASLALSARASSGSAPKRVEAAGLAGPDHAVVRLIGEVVIPPGEYEVSLAEPSRVTQRFRLERDGSVYGLCGHRRSKPSALRTRYLKTPSGEEWWAEQTATLYPCCVTPSRASSAPPPHAYALALYQPLRGIIRVAFPRRTWTVKSGEYLLSNPADVERLVEPPTWPVTLRRVTIWQPALRQFRERMGLPKSLGTFQFAGGPHRLTAGLKETLEMWGGMPSSPEPAWREAFAHLACDQLLMRLLMEHPNPWQNSYVPSPGIRWQDSRLNAALHYLAAHLTRPFSMAALAREAGAGESWLRKTFQETIGQSPNDYFQALRIKKAKELLKDPSLSVQDIALAVGYKSSQAFYRVFQAHAGASPKTFRQR